MTKQSPPWLSEPRAARRAPTFLGGTNAFALAEVDRGGLFVLGGESGELVPFVVCDGRRDTILAPRRFRGPVVVAGARARAVALAGRPGRSPPRAPRPAHGRLAGVLSLGFESRRSATHGSECKHRTH